jgi:hypothetical protein
MHSTPDTDARGARACYTEGEQCLAGYRLVKPRAADDRQSRRRIYAPPFLNSE